MIRPVHAMISLNLTAQKCQINNKSILDLIFDQTHGN